MYKQVDSSETLALFHKIKEVVWSSMGFEMEYAKEGSDLYLLLAEDGEAGGTFEFTPYPKSNAFIHSLFEEVITDDMKVMEVDSLAVLPVYRGQLGRKGICLMIDYAEKHGYTHAVGIADPTFFRSMNEKYSILATQINEKIFYKGADAIPTLFHLNEVYSDKDNPKYSWYIPRKVEVMR
ncbi:GNAT family N-acetyltransferase [Brevibacillus choshinensis]|uniref:GNAT family N-acetyltransferase n=1 Tax=Brevibacillus choshinensis TaxID=54911 RepID=UPI002E1F6797|nr:GNAT family N-acetyltransferase [Brevibacillus choshinensis]